MRPARPVTALADAHAGSGQADLTAAVERQPTRVLVVIDSLRLGGAESVLSTLARAAPHGHFTLEIVSLSPPSDLTTAMLGTLEAQHVRTRFLNLPRLAHPRALPGLMRAIRQSGAEVVHGHLEDATTLVPPAAALTGRGSLCTFHHMAVPLARRAALKERLAIEAGARADKMLFVSHASMASYARRYGQRRNWDVLHNGVDLLEFSQAPDTLPADLGIPTGASVTTIVGALRARKGHADALAAWPGVLGSHPEAYLLFVGAGPDEPRLRDITERLDLGDRVVFAGLRLDVPRLVRASTLILLPSSSEALPTALLEAAAASRAAVATDIPGVSEVLEHGVTGLTFPVGDIAALQTAVTQLLDDPGLRSTLGQGARAAAEMRFGMDLWARRLGSIYTHLARRRHHNPVRR